MGTKIEYVDTTHLYATKYIRNSKAIAVLWAIFTICYAIIGIVAFVTPEWVGDPDNESAGRLGLWQVCQRDEIFDNCKRRWETILSVPTFSFQLATFFMVAAVALALLTICFLVFLIFMKSTRVFHICGWMQIISALCMIVACAAFPFGWNSDDFRKICGPDANRFELGLCGIRWAYPLAIIGCVDGVVLATLAFILATRHVRLQPDPLYQSSLYKGEINNAYITDAVSLAGSRKSLNLQPILLVAPPQNMPANGDDTISQFSSRTPNHRYRPDYPMHQF
ncbi:PREDICTED: lipoma HMGIC fusion partner-like 3 protein isoform X1 [Rhagoletis zephyria]|uniref:lipoma HMGIC fusion partner-like 3 protein isoform X1 n=1 Tax=Rhagoletis zephyria TaxID=28612 RepID=UPI0008114410|nr:PREDICTED: lipoma HMGIC fusion partner-like 3 protein isoform X1 [Rhagoletis zephyria]